MLSVLFVFLYSMFYSFYRKINKEYFDSVFYSMFGDNKWWGGYCSWKNKTPDLFRFVIDAPHLFRFLSHVCILLAVVNYSQIITPLFDFFIFVIIHKVVKNFFNYILNK